MEMEFYKKSSKRIIWWESKIIYVLSKCRRIVKSSNQCDAKIRKASFSQGQSHQSSRWLTGKEKLEITFFFYIQVWKILLLFFHCYDLNVYWRYIMRA